MKPESVIPVLYSEDIRKSIAYYTETLGFEESWEWDDNPTFGGVNWGDVRIFFCKQDQGNPGTWLCINVENVDEYFEFIQKRGAKILSPPDDKPWFMREMLVSDPDGHIIRFGQGIECD
ncbi:glyoxalase superfamily protein [Dyadobacter sp. NIV53]|uniref:glyoxalase superfamily protein n=1 Tax=Dyadobacter sp. NIV53 TaxID=2861765 RepID=UPI001C869BEC|nr:glyoxalase superfamily protein [Dyadobacter sp. NIV53]